MLVEAIQTLAQAILNDTNRHVKRVRVDLVTMRAIALELRAPAGCKMVLLSCTGGEVEVVASSVDGLLVEVE